MNVSLEELLGTLTVTTQQLGRNERTFTGVRNVILRMSKAEEEGIKLTGSFTEKLQQLNKVDPETLKKIFGDEAISTIAVAAANANAVADAVGRLNQNADLVGDKLAGIFGDAGIRTGKNIESAQQVRKNIRAGGVSGDLLSYRERTEDTVTGLQATKYGQILDEQTIKNAVVARDVSTGAIDWVFNLLGKSFAPGVRSPGPLTQAAARWLTSDEGGMTALERGRNYRLQAQSQANPELLRQNILAESTSRQQRTLKPTFASGKKVDLVVEKLEEVSGKLNKVVDYARDMVKSCGRVMIRRPFVFRRR